MGYDTNQSRFAIMKAINYKDSSLGKIQKHVDYILDKNKSPEKYQKSWYVNREDALQGLERLYRRYHPKGTRNFKHWIISFGVPYLDKDKAFEVSKEIADYYGKDYPVVLGLHTNIPKRVHCHFLQNTVAIQSGEKFSQSRDDFDQFRLFINDVLDQYNLPLLKGVVSEEIAAQKHHKYTDEAWYTDDDKIWSSVQYLQPIQEQFVLPLNIEKNNVLVQGSIDMAETLKVFERIFDKFYKYGRGIKDEL